MPRGQGKRCTGFTSADGKWVRCSRDELAGGLPADDSCSPPVYRHLWGGACHCGVTHAPAPYRADSNQIEATYDYRDESGTLLYQVVRKVGKEFRQRRPDPTADGGWSWKLGDVRRVLYRLPELLAAPPDATVYVVEGEKDCESLARRGHIATCNPMGQGKTKWNAVVTLAQSALANRDVVVVADRDDETTTPPFAGQKHAKYVAETLGSVARSVRLLVPRPPHKDASDVLAAGGDLADLVPLAPPTPAPARLRAEEEPPEWLDDEAEPAIGVRVATTTFHKCTETGNGERFAARYRGQVRYCPPWGKWLLWDGTRWAVDTRGEVMALAKKVVRSIYEEAAACDDSSIRSAIAEWAHKSESRAARSAMIELAQSEEGISVLPDELDADPWLLNTTNCTIDLRTGVPREHRREDLLTRRTAAPFKLGARSDLWERTLLDATGGDADLVSFFQRAAGYSCTGLTSEEVLFMVVGPAASGKSTILQALLGALGEYGKTADFEAFLDKKNAGGPKNEIARLAGSRLVASIEVDKGKRLAQGLVKTLTGGDVVTARFLYQEAFEFKPTFALWLVCNDAPIVADDDTGMWRRMLRIPLDHVVPEGKRDPQVKATLVDPEVSGPAILAWIVEGCVQWQAKKLSPPGAVKAATNSYREEQDPLREFLTDVCILDPAVRCTKSDLRDAYESWVKESGDRVPLIGKDFAARIRRLEGVTEGALNGVRRWIGIGCLGASEEADRYG